MDRIFYVLQIVYICKNQISDTLIKEHFVNDTCYKIIGIHSNYATR